MTEYELVSETIFASSPRDEELSVEIPNDALELEVEYTSRGVGPKAVVQYLIPVGEDDD